MGTQVDLTRKSGLISVGVHNFIVVRAREEEGASGFPYWGFTCECLDKGDDNGREVYHMVSLSPKARFKVDEFLDAMGAPEKGKATMDQFIGRKFRGDVIHDTWEERETAKFKTIFPATSQPSLPGLKGSTGTESESLPDDVVEKKAPF